MEGNKVHCACRRVIGPIKLQIVSADPPNHMAETSQTRVYEIYIVDKRTFSFLLNFDYQLDILISQSNY